MYLHELERDKDIKIFCEVSDGSKYVVFGHIDGMYSYCTSEKGEVVHLAAMTPLIEVEGGYKIDISTDNDTDTPDEPEEEEKKPDDDDDDDSSGGLLGGLGGGLDLGGGFSGFGGGESGGGGSNGSW